MKKCTVSFLLGVLSVLAYGWHLGPTFLIQTGLRLNAAQETYVWTAEPQMVVDEQMIVAELAKPVARKEVRRQK